MNIEELARNADFLRAYTPTVTAGGAMTVSSPSITGSEYLVLGQLVIWSLNMTMTLGGVADPSVMVTTPIPMRNNVAALFAGHVDNFVVGAGYKSNTSEITINRFNGNNWNLGAGRHIRGVFIYFSGE